VDSLPLGPIEVLASKTGFQTVDRTGVDLVVGQDATVNLQLPIGSKVEHMDVAEGIRRQCYDRACFGSGHRRAGEGSSSQRRSLDNLIAINRARSITAPTIVREPPQRWQYVLVAAAGQATISSAERG